MNIEYNQKLFYRFSEHGLYYRPDFTTLFEVVTLTIGTIQLEIDCKSMKLLGACGFVPLKHRAKVKIPAFSEGDFLVKINNFDYCSGIAYDYFNFFPGSKKYLMNDEYNPKLTFDEDGKRILVGIEEEGDIYVKISENVICGLDKKSSTLKSMLIMIDEIKE